MGLFKKIKNIVEKNAEERRIYNEKMEKERKLKYPDFIQFNDPENKSTSFQCPKCKSFNVESKIIQKHAKDYYSPEDYTYKKCQDCGYELTEKV